MSARRSKIKEVKPEVINYMKVYNDKVVLYPSFELFNTHRGNSSNSLNQLVKGQKIGSNGFLMDKGRVKIQKYINIWTTAVIHYMRANRIPVKFRYKYLTFCTLTLPSQQLHCDKTIKKCLTTWLKNLEKTYGNKAYLWVSELQQNGNIHFHILLSIPLHYKQIRSTWNTCIQKLGYIDRFEEKHGHRNAPTENIRSLYSINNPSAYITEYAKKGSFVRNQCGRIWGSSSNLSKIEEFKDYSKFFIEDINDFIEKNPKSLYDQEYFSIINTWELNKTSTEKVFSKENFKKIQNYYCEVFNFIYN